MTREYVDDHHSRITIYQLNKTITYEREDVAELVGQMLERLRSEDFGWLYIPEFEYRVDGCELSLCTDYIKGSYTHEPIKLYSSVVLRDSPYTFTDPHPSNFIKCKKDEKTYAIDLDSYCHVEDRDMHAVFMRKWESYKVIGSEWVKRDLAKIESKYSRTDSARGVDHP